MKLRKCPDLFLFGSGNGANNSIAHGRISVGMDAPIGSHPWVASLRLLSSTSEDDQRSVHKCGATILNEFNVLTAAHCLSSFPHSRFRVRVGDWDMKQHDSHEQEFQIRAVHINPWFGLRTNWDNDIAIIKVKPSGVEDGRPRGIRFNKEKVVPACLPPESARYSKKLNCGVGGFGSTSGGATPRYMQQASLPYIPSMTCKKPHVYGKDKITDTMFCAGYLEGGIDTCQGDSGSGYVCQENGVNYVYGITSWGIGKCMPY